LGEQIGHARTFIGDLLHESLLQGEGLGGTGDDLLQLRLDEFGQLAGWNRAGDDPGGGRLGAGHEITGDDEVHRPVVADPVEEDMVAAGVEHRADRGEGGAELRVIGGIDDVGGRSDAEAQTQRSAWDLRDDGDRQGPDRLEDGAKTSARNAWASSVSTSMFEMSRPELKTLPSPRMRSTRTLGIASATLATAAAISRRLSASRALRDSGPSRTISAIWPRLRNWISVMGAPLLLVMPVVDSPPVSGGVSPSVEALPGFSADLTGFDLVAQDLRR